MELDDPQNAECPICYDPFVYYPVDWSNNFDGKDRRSAYTNKCKHCICKGCCRELSKQRSVACPLCREDWTEFIHTYYGPAEEEDEEDEDDEEEEDEEDEEEEDEADEEEDEDDNLGIIGVWHDEYNNDNGISHAEWWANIRAGRPWQKPSSAANRIIHGVPDAVYISTHQYDQEMLEAELDSDEDEEMRGLRADP